MRNTTVLKKAYNSFRSQLDRCYNDKCRAYQWYGAKGIKVLYSFEEFYPWFKEEFEKKQWRLPCIGRTDHGDHYRFGNISIEEKSDNSKERMMRLGTNIKPWMLHKKVIVIDVKTNEELYIADSLKEAARRCGSSSGRISQILKKGGTVRGQYSFKKVEKNAEL